MAEKKGPKEPEAAPPHQPEPDNSGGNAEQNVAPISGPPTDATPQLRPPEEKNPETKPERKWTHDIGMFGATVAGVLVVGAYTCVAAWQACLQSNTIEEMQREQRPWVFAINIEPAGHIVFVQERGVYAIPLKYSITNTGHLPAFAVIAKSGAVIRAIGTSTMNVQNDVCDDYRSDKSGSGQTVFAGQTVEQSGFESEDYPTVDKDDWDNTAGGKLIVVYGCVDYQFPDEPRHHQSRFRFVLGTTKDQNGLKRIGTLPDDPTAGDVRLKPVEGGEPPD